MLPYAAYKVYQKRKENQRDMEDALSSLTSNLSRSIIPDQVVMKIHRVSAKLVEDSDDFIPGTLSIVEKAQGVFIEWAPYDESIDSGWVIPGENGSEESIRASPPSLSPNNSTPSVNDAYSKLKFSLDVNDLSSFRNVEPKKKEKSGKMLHYIRLICKDGTSYVPLYFQNGETTSFFTVLQRYITLRRSARDPTLVLVVDTKAEALAQSVSALDQNGDILSRLMKNPYSTAMTGFSKITSFMQDQVIPALLDSDEVSQEEKIRAMRELRLKDEDHQLRVHSDAGGEFEVVTQLDLPARPEIFRESPVTKADWDKFKLPDGTFDQQKLHHLKMSIFRGGLSEDLRKEAWKYLLDYKNWFETQATFEKKRVILTEEYNRMKAQWQSISEDQESRFFKYSKRKGLVEKDVARTDRTVPYFQGDNNQNLKTLQNILMCYVMYNFDLGYVQGMSDFAAPILYVMNDEIDAFWCFVGLMQKIQPNFEKDQANIKLQMAQLKDLLVIVNPKLANYLESHQSDDMYFCFRWVLVWFKREFNFSDTCKLWEVLWTGQLCPNFLLLFCIAILDSQTNIIIDNQFGLTEILKHVNDLSGHLNLDSVLTSAEAIFHQLSASQDKLPLHIREYLNFSRDEPTSSTP